MKKKIYISILIACMLLIAANAFSSIYYMCVYKVSVQKVISKPIYNHKKKNYSVHTKFIVHSCVKKGGFIPNTCDKRINKTYVKNILFSSKRYNRFIKTGSIIKLKYAGASGYNNKGKYSWRSWTFIK